MCILSYIFHPVVPKSIEYGFLLPSPDKWDFNPFWSWMVNTLLLLLTSLLLFFVNKSYNFVRTTEPSLLALFLIMSTSGPWFTEGLNSSVLICLANVVCLGIIFDSYDSRNATQEMFTLGLVAGMGGMVQYGFFPMGILYFLWSLFMKVMRVKEVLAYIAGLLCPYWIFIGIGWLSFSDIHYPSLTPMFSYIQDPSELIILLTGISLAAILGFIISMVNSIKLYAGNSKVNAMNLCVISMGVMSLLCIILDFENMSAYVETLYLATAVQIANICALWNPREPWMVTVFPGVCYIGLFACSLFL